MVVDDAILFVNSMTEEDKFFAQLLTPNIRELEEYWNNHGLEYRDFVTILMDRAKMSRRTIEKLLTVLYKMQVQVEAAKRLSLIGRTKMAGEP